MSAQRRLLSPNRWHFQHGPIDLIIQADGDQACVARAHEQAWGKFQDVLPTLAGELSVLRQAVQAQANNPFNGAIARMMWEACAPLANAFITGHDGFITPMAAVAGSVAQSMLACYQQSGVTRAWVNNGGDIALHLTEGTSSRIGLVSDIARAWAKVPGAQDLLDGELHVTAQMPVRGIATSGWRGRSHSLGIADSVTVLAMTASQADAAVTLIANAVNISDARIVRQPANQLRDDSDLGERCVTVAVPSLPAHLVAQALAKGHACAQDLQARGLVHAALLCCQGQFEYAGQEACLAG
ncbi:MAG: UPF0280 family protein [Betaproteobacteria bacterium]|jgi:ApbE superfamily uncharacterized protein (UPF0280 family)|nr:UPF0280 family protein [Burkholderiales bacterium]NBX91330.1 UPF0280 family protein [Betaproteobacteria bacterium]